MISQLRGLLLEARFPYILLEVGGVGYEIETSRRTFQGLPAMQSELTIQTHLITREDGQRLFGFLTRAERMVFRYLIRVKNVGPKLALSILSQLTPEQLMETIQSENETMLAKIPGIGSKTSRRLIIEMREFLKEWRERYPAKTIDNNNNKNINFNKTLDEAHQALIALGYRAPLIQEVLNNITASQKSSQKSLSLQQLIYLSLQHLSNKK